MPRKGGVISGGFQPLKAPDAPAINSTTAGYQSIDVAFSAPSNTGAGTITSYTVTSLDSTDGTQAVQSVASSPASFSYSDTNEKTFAIQAFSEYGPGAWSGYGNATNPGSSFTVYLWGGTNQKGFVGVNTNGAELSPQAIGGSWSSFRSAADINENPTAVAVRDNGTIWGWGSNNAGQAGLNDRVARSSPVQIGSLSTWKDVAGMQYTTAAIKTDGTFWAWGATFLINNGGPYRSSPVQVGSDTDWSHFITNGGGNGVALYIAKTDGSIYTLGSEPFNLSYVNTSSPVQIDSAYVDVLTSYSALHLVKNDGTLWAVNDSGAYGTGGLGNVIKTSSPVQLGAETNWSTNQNGVAVGDTAFYVKENGTLYGSGRGNVLASGANTDYSSPVQVATNVTAWAGHTQTANFIINGGLYATGVYYSQYGTSGIGSAVNYNLTQVGSATDWVYLIANERAAGGGRA